MNLAKIPHRNSTRIRHALFQRRRQMHDPLLVLNESPDRPLAGSSFTPKLGLRVVGRTEGAGRSSYFQGSSCPLGAKRIDLQLRRWLESDFQPAQVSRKRDEMKVTQT